MAKDFAFRNKPEIQGKKVFTNTWSGRGTPLSRGEVKRNVRQAANVALKMHGGKIVLDADEDAYFRKPRKGETPARNNTEAYQMYRKGYGKYGDGDQDAFYPAAKRRLTEEE